MNIGVFRSVETLRKEIVSFLESHPNSPDGTPLELFTGTPWSQYLRLMARTGTYGDHLTLQAAADVTLQRELESIMFAWQTNFRDETGSDPPDTESNSLPPVQDEQSELDSTSGIDVPEDQLP
ncbi:hypothetical protein OS493_019334 [Desmophyllum pertusum]|uniref:Uncharacterized protein n=1 Tax=Desmophyllum pertusum TaxID=174260 RepID=A0A9X0A0G4_9CNID|nr:hypothetical protein OS493_019334 [Desmophyllum pertusum]